LAVRTLLPTDPTAHDGTRYPQTPMKIKMGNWIGCLDASDPATTGTCQWAGGQAVLNADSNYQMLVKSVTIEDAGCGAEYTYGDMSGTWQSIKTSGDCGGKAVISSSSASSSSSSSTSSASSTKSSSTKSSSTGGVFAETSTSTSTSKASSSTSASSSSESSKSDESSKTAATTLTTATGSPSTTAAQTGSGTSATSTPAATVAPTNSSNTTKSKYGALDFAVIVLGLGLGYLVM